MSKERGPSVPGRTLRPAFAAFAIIATLLAAFVLRDASEVSARVFGAAIVDPAKVEFHNGDFDVSDASIFFLAPSDGVPGIGLTPDTFFAPVGATVWIGAAVEEGQGPVTFDSDDYGTFTKALCNDNNGDTADFNDPLDNCVNVAGLGTDEMIIPDAGNSLEHQPPAGFPRMGLAVAFKCQATAGIANMTISQGPFSFEFFIICAGQLASTQFSATDTKLEIWPQPGSTDHSLIRLELFDASGFIVFGYEVDWSVNRCAIETESVDNVGDADEARRALQGQVDLTQTAPPDSTPQLDSARNLVGDFNADGRLEAISLAVLHCEPSHSPTNTPGPIVIRAHISKEGEASRDVSFTINLIGPPAQIFLTANPTTVRCGEKVTLTAVVVDSIGQFVSDHTRVEFVMNLGGTSTTNLGMILGLVVPLSSSVGQTFDGVAQSFMLTSNFNVGTYVIVATAEGVFSTPPVSANTSITCFIPPTATPAPAVTIVAPSTGTGATADAPAGIAIRPPNTGDGGLR